MYLKLVVSSALVLFSSGALAQTGSNADCAQPGARVRKSWKIMHADEKKLFKDAVADLMKSGVYFELQNLHGAKMSFSASHSKKQCSFLPWHRSFLMVFENALRAQDPKYRCVTVPIWEIFEEFGKQSSDGEDSCKNLHDCSPILNEMCGVPGSTDAKQEIIVVPGYQAMKSMGYFHNGYPCDQLCSHNTTIPSPGTCIPGVLRTAKENPALPADVGYANMLKLFNEESFYMFSQEIFSGFHGSVHSLVGGKHGYLVTYASPNDPMFYIWHATVDYVYWLLHKCKVGDTIDDSSPYSLASCPAGDKSEGSIDYGDASDEVKKLLTQVATEYKQYHHMSTIPENFRYVYQVSPEAENRIVGLKLSDKTACPAYQPVAAPATPVASPAAPGAPEGPATPGAPAPDTPATPAPGPVEAVDEYIVWYKTTEAKLQALYPNDAKKVAEELALLECIGFYQQFGDVDYTPEFLEGQDINPTCNVKAEEVQTGEVKVPVTIDHFDAAKVETETYDPTTVEIPVNTDTGELQSDAQGEVIKTQDVAKTTRSHAKC